VFNNSDGQNTGNILVNYKYCVSDSSNFDTDFHPDCTKFCSVFFRLLDRKFNDDSKNVLKTVTFSLQVGFISDFALDYRFNLSF